MTNNFTITDKAKKKIGNLLEKENINKFFRIEVKGGGCSGLTYDLDFDDTIVDFDDVSEDQGLKLVIDRRSLLYLLGTELDFTEGLNGKGFQFINPNASRTCGCGESFAI